MSEMTMTLNSPLTDEDWDLINDVELEHTNEITFHTKHGRFVKFVKEQKWIPCSERLPENNEICLVCGKNGGIRVARVYLPAATGHWNGDPNTNWWTIVGTGKSYNPVAWMPLPEPYLKEKKK